MRVFVDTNVLLDVLANRVPFAADSSCIWTLAERGRIEAGVSVISFNNVYYVLRRHGGRASAEKALRLLRDVFRPVAFDTQLLQQAVDAGFDDFEDAVQYFSAIRDEAGCLISRNPDHFPRSGLPVLTPKEFLAVHAPGEGR